MIYKDRNPDEWGVWVINIVLVSGSERYENTPENIGVSSVY